MSTNKKCSICEKEIEGMGHNPQPMKNQKGEELKVEDRCCLECNNSEVVPLRVSIMNEFRRLN